MAKKRRKAGWYGESHRHSLAGRGIKSGTKSKHKASIRKPRTHTWWGEKPSSKKVDTMTTSLMDKEVETWEKLGIRSGSELERSPALQRKYIKEMKKYLKGKHYPEEVYLLLEDQNRHTLNDLLVFEGYGDYPKRYGGGKPTYQPNTLTVLGRK